MITIHLHIRAMLDKIFCFVTGFHLAAIDTAVTGERGLAGRSDIGVWGVFKLGSHVDPVFPRRFYLTAIVAIFFITLPA
jgi:hypothetical protein